MRKIILAAGWAVVLLIAYPGLMTTDSFDQLEEARNWYFTDSHPPAMAALWGVLDRMISGPFLMLVLQTGTFLAGLYLLAKRAISPQRSAVVAPLLFLFPPILASMMVIWKDAPMAGFLILGSAGVLSSRRAYQLLGLAALVAGMAVRYNAPAATLPLVVLGLVWRADLRPLRRYGIALAAWVVTTALAFGLNALLTDQKMYFWNSSLALADISGTLTKVDDNVPDAALEPLLRPTQIRVDRDYQAAIRARYRSATFTELIAPDTGLWSVPIAGTTPAPASQREAIDRAWSEIVWAHPGAYVRYRFDTFAEILGLRSKFQGMTVIQRRAQQPERMVAMHLAEQPSRFQLRVERVLVQFRKTLLFRPHLYALLALLLLPFAWRQRDVLALLLSGLAMELSLLVFASTPDFRYSHWLVVCVCLSLVMLVARRARGAA